jgi:hypothetical protein
MGKNPWERGFPSGCQKWKRTELSVTSCPPCTVFGFTIFQSIRSKTKYLYVIELQVELYFAKMRIAVQTLKSFDRSLNFKGTFLCTWWANSIKLLLTFLKKRVLILQMFTIKLIKLVIQISYFVSVNAVIVLKYTVLFNLYVNRNSFFVCK